VKLRAPLALLALASVCSTARAQLPTEPVTYELRVTSSYTEGCFEPCMCPIWIVDHVGGTFELHPTGADGGFQEFTVAAVDWSFTRAGQPARVSGSGTWRLDPGAGLQRLELDLQIGEEPAAHFDSGLVEMPVEPPDLRVAVAMNGFYCFDHAFEVVAVPVAGIGDSVISWGVQKARY
jgi:hypothetical protein